MSSPITPCRIKNNNPDFSEEDESPQPPRKRAPHKMEDKTDILVLHIGYFKEDLITEPKDKSDLLAVYAKLSRHENAQLSFFVIKKDAMEMFEGHGSCRRTYKQIFFLPEYKQNDEKATKAHIKILLLEMATMENQASKEATIDRTPPPDIELGDEEILELSNNSSSPLSGRNGSDPNNAATRATETLTKTLQNCEREIINKDTTITRQQEWLADRNRRIKEQDQIILSLQEQIKSALPDQSIVITCNPLELHDRDFDAVLKQIAEGDPNEGLYISRASAKITWKGKKYKELEVYKEIKLETDGWYPEGMLTLTRNVLGDEVLVQQEGNKVLGRHELKVHVNGALMDGTVDIGGITFRVCFGDAKAKFIQKLGADCLFGYQGYYFIRWLIRLERI